MEKFISSSVFKQDLKKAVLLAEELECGIEISRFKFFTSTSVQNEVIEVTNEALKNFSGSKNVHAYFFDLNVAGRDPEIVEISQKRHVQTFEFARDIGATTIVFHTGYNPFKHIDFQNKFYDKYKTFWEDYIKYFETSDITAVLENVMENSPKQNLSIVEHINSDKLRLSIDTGHVNAYSDKNISEWIDAYGNKLCHMHIHNNFGDNDSHNSICDGTLDFNAIFSQIQKLNLSPEFVFEIFEEKNLRESINLFNKFFIE